MPLLLTAPLFSRRTQDILLQRRASRPLSAPHADRTAAFLALATALVPVTRAGAEHGVIKAWDVRLYHLNLFVVSNNHFSDGFPHRPFHFSGLGVEVDNLWNNSLLPRKHVDLTFFSPSVPDGHPSKPRSPFGFSRVLRRRGLQQTLGPLTVGLGIDVPWNNSILFPQPRVRN
jgi:hypothetical protein